MSRWDSIGSCRLVADCSRVVVPVKYASRSDIKTIQTPVIAHGAALRAMVGVSIQNANMATKIPSKVSDRISAGVKRFQPILESAKSRDVGESDTVTIIADMLSEVFGFDKYSEVTSEFAIRGTYCDLAIKLDNQLQMLIEAKAIGSELREGHLKQAVDYAANQGADWVVLTNGTIWRIYKVIFGKPIDQELVFEVNFATISHKSAKDIESIYLICKEGWLKSVLGEYHSQKQALSRFYLGAMVLSDVVLQTIRRELRRVSPDLKVEIEEIREVLTTEVIKRDVLEGDKAIEAKRKINRAANKVAKAKAAAKADSAAASTAVETQSDSDDSNESDPGTEANEEVNQ